MAILKVNTVCENKLNVTVFPETSNTNVDGVLWSPNNDLKIAFETDGKSYKLLLKCINCLAHTEDPEWMYNGHLYVNGVLADYFLRRRVYSCP